MRRGFRLLGTLLCATCVGVALPRDAAAQVGFENAGERALGMGGAFVAVSDDATATHWNPAGLVTGGPAGMTIGASRFQFGNPDGVATTGAERRRSTLTAFGAWPVGLSVARFERTRLLTGAAGTLEAETTRTTQWGMTVLQSLLPGVIVGSTFKYVRGDSTRGAVEALTTGSALDAGARFKSGRRGQFDLDLGIMATADLARIGVTVKNLRSPVIGDPDAADAPRLPRQVRAGLAVFPVSGLILAMDVDLTAVDPGGGQRRVGAVGGEVALGSHVTARSGMRWSLVGPKHPVAAMGLSVSVRRGLWLDGHVAQRRSDDIREFGVALRAGF